MFGDIFDKILFTWLCFQVKMSRDRQFGAVVTSRLDTAVLPPIGLHENQRTTTII
jgi:hypothetical protein